MGLRKLFGLEPKTANDIAQKQLIEKGKAIKSMEKLLENDRKFIKDTFRVLCDRTNRHEDRIFQLRELEGLNISKTKVDPETVHDTIEKELISLKKLEQAMPLLKN